MEGTRSNYDNQLVLVPQRVGERKFLRAGSKRKTKIRPFYINRTKDNSITSSSVRRKQKAGSSIRKSKKKSGKKPRGEALKDLQKNEIDNVAAIDFEDAAKLSKQDTVETVSTPTSSDRENISPCQGKRSVSKMATQKSLEKITASLARTAAVGGSGDLTHVLETVSRTSLAAAGDVETGSGDTTHSANPQELSNTLSRLTPHKHIMSSPLASSARRATPRHRARASIANRVDQTGGQKRVRENSRCPSAGESHKTSEEDAVGEQASQSQQAAGLNETFTVEDTGIDKRRADSTQESGGMVHIRSREGDESRHMFRTRKSRKASDHAYKMAIKGDASGNIAGESAVESLRLSKDGDPVMEAQVQGLERTLGGMSPLDLQEKIMTAGDVRKSRKSHNVVVSPHSVKNKSNINANSNSIAKAPSVRKSLQWKLSEDSEPECVDAERNDSVEEIGVPLEDSTEVDIRIHQLSRADRRQSSGRTQRGGVEDEETMPEKTYQSESEDDERGAIGADGDDVDSFQGEEEQELVPDESIRETTRKRAQRLGGSRTSQGSPDQEPISDDVESSNKNSAKNEALSHRGTGEGKMMKHTRQEGEYSPPRSDGVNNSSPSLGSAQKNSSSSKEASSRRVGRRKGAAEVGGTSRPNGEMDQTNNNLNTRRQKPDKSKFTEMASRKRKSRLKQDHSVDHEAENDMAQEGGPSRMNKNNRDSKHNTSSRHQVQDEQSLDSSDPEGCDYPGDEPSVARGSDAGDQKRRSREETSRGKHTRVHTPDENDAGTKGTKVQNQTGDNMNQITSAGIKKLERLQKQLGGMSPLDRTLDLLSKSRAKLRETMPSLMSPEALRVGKASTSRTLSAAEAPPGGRREAGSLKGKDIPHKKNKVKVVGQRRGAKKGTWPPRTPKMVLDSDTGDASQSAHSIASESELEEPGVSPVVKKRRTVNDLCDLDVILECTWEEAQAARWELSSKRLKTVHDTIIRNTTGDLLELINLHSQLKNLRNSARSKNAEVTKKRGELLDLQQQQRVLSSSIAKRKRQVTLEMDSGIDQDEFLASLSSLYRERRTLSTESM